MENEDPGKIVPPEPYVAIPVIIALSYSMEVAALRDFYAKLLAKSMIIDTKDQVHPAFVEIIKQMSPIDAENIGLFRSSRVITVCKFIPAEKDFKDYKGTQLQVFYESPPHQNNTEQSISIASLIRLGLIETIYDDALQDKKVNVDDFVRTERWFELVNSIERELDPETYINQANMRFREGRAILTEFGKAFLKTVT